MKVLTAKVTNSVELEVPEGILEEGATVTLLVLEAGEAFAVTPEEALAVLEAISLKVTEARLKLKQGATEPRSRKPRRKPSAPSRKLEGRKP